MESTYKSCLWDDKCFKGPIRYVLEYQPRLATEVISGKETLSIKSLQKKDNTFRFEVVHPIKDFPTESNSELKLPFIFLMLKIYKQ